MVAAMVEVQSIAVTYGSLGPYGSCSGMEIWRSSGFGTHGAFSILKDGFPRCGDLSERMEWIGGRSSCRAVIRWVIRYRLRYASLILRLLSTSDN